MRQGSPCTPADCLGTATPSARLRRTERISIVWLQAFVTFRLTNRAALREIAFRGLLHQKVLIFLGSLSCTNLGLTIQHTCEVMIADLFGPKSPYRRRCTRIYDLRHTLPCTGRHISRPQQAFPFHLTLGMVSNEGLAAAAHKCACTPEESQQTPSCRGQSTCKYCSQRRFRNPARR